jgi:ribose transport system ATP-binding protein
MISSELPELIGLCDRIIVIKNGKTSGELSGAAITEENILQLAT